MHDLWQHHAAYFCLFFQKLEGRKLQLLDEVKLIASPDRAYKNYKEKLRNINPPCVPFVGKFAFVVAS